ncbi:MFS transporter [Defluviimonas sp. D31]|uniref:MFS transporter n=1 Tax=Defluviimonas sp. D31 TaxID=3083253 RepID=UPI00296E81B7|nr:MFS transporter [Defluviimonas sp. D31]
MALSLLVMMFGTLRAFDTAIQPEMDKRARLIGSTVRDGFERALELGLPLSAIAGSDRFLQKVLTDFDEVRAISIVATDGTVISRADRQRDTRKSVVSRVASVGAEQRPQFRLPILNRNTLVGELRIEVDPAYVRTRLQDVLLDVFVVGLISVLLAFELVIFVTAAALGKPLDRILTLLRMQAKGVFSHVIMAADAGNLRRIARRISDRAMDLSERAVTASKLTPMPQAYFVDVRLPLFVFSTATEIGGAFLPLYARDSGGPEWMTGDFAAIAPLIAYLAAIALVAPFGGVITRLVSPRLLFLSCIPLTAAAMVGVGLGQSALWIAVWFGAMALVYAAATIACQEYAIRTAPKGEHAQAIGSYLFVILGGAFSGTALGGVLADRIGANGTFFFGAALVVISGLLGALTISGNVSTRDVAQTPEQEQRQTGGLAVFRDVRFISLVFGVGATMNIGMSVFIWYLTPVILEAENARIADIGRTMMLYYLVPVLVGPTVARLADGRIGYAPMLIGGAVLAGCALSSLAFWSGFWPMVFVVATFGLAYAMCDATQYAQAIRLAEATGAPGARDAGLGALRLIERLAAISGLVASAYLAEHFDYVSLAVAVGLLMFVGAFMMILAETGNALLQKRVVEDLS